MVAVPKVSLNNGNEMPVLGLGTYLAKSNEVEEAVKYALDIGYRHIDTAFYYENEQQVGSGIRQKISEGVVKRKDIFLVTKLPSIHNEPSKVEGSCKKSLESLGVDYLDLYLIHFPIGSEFDPTTNQVARDDKGNIMFNDVDFVDTWREMEKLVEKGLVKSIGISNFNSEQTKRILDICKIKPVTNQVECHIGFNQKKLIEFSKQHDIIITAYCPLARPNAQEKKPAFLFNENFVKIAEKYKKTATQVALRYLIQVGTVPIPKSVTKERIAENFNVFDFELSADEIKFIDTLHAGERVCKFEMCAHLKNFPFAIEF